MSDWQDIETAPKDRPILGWCNHEADPYHDGEGRLTDYGANCEGMGHVEDGPHVIEWRQQEWESQDEYGSGFWIPGWWVRFGSDGEEYANPVGWTEIPRYQALNKESSE